MITDNENNAGNGGVNLEVGGVKFRIFKLTYKAQFWSYEHIINMFLVRFDLKKHLRTISEHFEHQKHIFGRVGAHSWR